MSSREKSNKLKLKLCQLLAHELNLRRVVLIFDPNEQLRSFFEDITNNPPNKNNPGNLDLGDIHAKWLIGGNSLFKLRHEIEPLISKDLPDPLLIYLPKRNENECRSTLIELISSGSVFDPQLLNRASYFLREVMEPEKVKLFLKRTNLSYSEIAFALDESSKSGFSQLKALFQKQQKRESAPENSDLILFWLVHDELDDEIFHKQLINELQDLLKSRWSMCFPEKSSLTDLRLEAQRTLLINEFLHDWNGEELKAFSRQSLPLDKSSKENALFDVKTLRRNYPEEYIFISNRIETELNLRNIISGAKPGVLGSIDTFQCEEQFLLQSVDKLISDDLYFEAKELIKARKGSFWLFGQPTNPLQAKRRQQWDLAHTAADFGLSLDKAENKIPSSSSRVEEWVSYQKEIAFRADTLQRRLEQQVAELTPSIIEIRDGLKRLRLRYEELLDNQARRFVNSLEDSGWFISNAISQKRMWIDRVQIGAGRIVIFWVDALRYEMGASLYDRFIGWSKDHLSDLKLEIAQASLPSITPVCMASLLPGAENNLSVVEKDTYPCVFVDGVSVGWSDGKSKRLAHLRQRVPTVNVMTLVDLIRTNDNDLSEKLNGDGPVIVTSTGIDMAGERDCDENFSNVRTDMQQELDNIEFAVRRLSNLSLKYPLERFLITADHGFLHLPLGRKKAMRIDAPVGKQFKLERRCWLGFPSEISDQCIEIPPASTGFGNDGLSVVVPRSSGVLKAGGSLCYHHGGATIQELLIPVLSFRCKQFAISQPQVLESSRPKNKRKFDWPGNLPQKVTNRILMLPINWPIDLLNQGKKIHIILAAFDSKTDELIATPIQVIGAALDRETNRITIIPGQIATIGIMLPAEVFAKKLNFEIRDAATNLVLYKSLDLPIDLIG